MGRQSHQHCLHGRKVAVMGRMIPAQQVPGAAAGQARHLPGHGSEGDRNQSAIAERSVQGEMLSMRAAQYQHRPSRLALLLCLALFGSWCCSAGPCTAPLAIKHANSRLVLNLHKHKPVELLLVRRVKAARTTREHC